MVMIIKWKKVVKRIMLGCRERQLKMQIVDGFRLIGLKNFKIVLRRSNEVIEKRWKKVGYELVIGLEIL